MSTDQSIFTPETPATDPNAQSTSILAELVGPDKKFTDAEALAKGKAEADAFIAQLQNENKQMREDLTKRSSVEDAIKQFSEAQRTQSAGTPAPAPTTDELAKLVSNLLNQKEAEGNRRSNLQVTEDAMIAKFGSVEAAKKAVADKATELGVNPKYLADTAAATPKAFYSLMGIVEQRTPQAPAGEAQRSSVNSQARPSTDDAARLKQYYDDMYKNDKQRYYSTAVQQEKFKLVQEGKLSFE